MTQLLEKLTKHAKVEATEALRQLVAALNGQAAIYIIKEEVLRPAVSWPYSQVFRRGGSPFPVDGPR